MRRRLVHPVRLRRAADDHGAGDHHQLPVAAADHHPVHPAARRDCRPSPMGRGWRRDARHVGRRPPWPAAASNPPHCSASRARSAGPAPTITRKISNSDTRRPPSCGRPASAPRTEPGYCPSKRSGRRQKALDCPWFLARSPPAASGLWFWPINRPASLLAPFFYGQLLWVSVLGFLVFGNLPDIWTIVGATIIAASGLYTAHRERVRRQERRRATPGR